MKALFVPSIWCAEVHCLGTQTVNFGIVASVLPTTQWFSFSLKPQRCLHSLSSQSPACIITRLQHTSVGEACGNLCAAFCRGTSVCAPPMARTTLFYVGKGHKSISTEEHPSLCPGGCFTEERRAQPSPKELSSGTTKGMWQAEKQCWS